MRSTAFKEYAETTRRLAGLGKKLYDAIDARSSTDDLIRNQVMLLRSAKRRQTPLQSIENHRESHELPDEEQPLETRTLFARELGDTWVEVEPGIYEPASSPASERVRIAGR
jgi:hypothetical protein